MSLYNYLFSCHPASDQILSALRLTKADFGRFRDCRVTNGKVAVYTRNGGSNRRCWCAEDPRYGYEACRHVVIADEIDETEQIDLETGSGLCILQKTGRKIIKRLFLCQHPDSADCGCPGCIITHRLPKHPSYLRSQDDRFDSTYATVWFKIPNNAIDSLKPFETSEEWDPDLKWEKAFDRLKREGIGGFDASGVFRAMGVDSRNHRDDCI